jgi:ribonuclease R
MLPESLSNGLCSLNPNVDRLVMVCEMRINNAGKMTAYQFSEGVIRSHARLTYNQVNALLNSPKSNLARKIRRRLADIEPHIQGLHQLYGALSQARKRRGALDFETQEVQFQFNTDKKIERIVPVQRNDAHRLIEECMLCANVATARFLQKLKLPALYRIHDGPQPKKLAALRAFLAEKGLQLGGGDKPTPAHYDRVLSGLDGRSDAQTIRTMMLRSLSQAEYNPENQGHFGLAYPAYAHFTSPIRRYPDLLVHRAIRSVIRAPENRRPLARTLEFLTGFGTKPINRVKGASVLEPGKSYPYDMPDLDTLADHCSTVSRRADKAAWDVDAWLKCEFMQARIGEMFDVVVSTATSFGLFAEIEQTRIEGLLHITELGQNHYHFDAVKQRLVEERSNTCFGPGDTLKVRVARVDMEQRRIEFELPKQKHKAPDRKRNRRRSRKAAVQG